MFTTNIQVGIRRIYKKSLKPELEYPIDTPDMLLVPENEGGTLPNPTVPALRKKKFI